MSEFHKIFSFLKNIISLYLILIRTNVKVVVTMEGDHLATWDFSGSNEIRIKLIRHLCEQWCTGVRAIPENMELDNHVLAFHHDTSPLFSLPTYYLNLRK